MKLLRYLELLFLYSLCQHLQVSFCDTWITLWNKLDSPLEIRCQRDGLFKKKDFKSKTVGPNERYDIKAKYPMIWLISYYRHWCDVTSGTTSISFDIFGGSDKRINRISDSYSDWVINKRGVYRVKNGKLMYYYGENWLSDDYESIDDDVTSLTGLEFNTEDVQQIAPLEVHLTSSTLSLAEQRYAINKATYASNKYKSSIEMGKYVSSSMQKKFGMYWAVFIDEPESGKIVKRTCDTDKVMIFHVNNIDFIVCQVMR